MEKWRSKLRFAQLCRKCGWQVPRFRSCIEAELILVLILRVPDIYLDGNNIIEFNSNNRRNIIVGIRVIGICGAGSRPRKKNHACENEPAYPPMCQQEHLCFALHVLRGLYFGSGIPNTAHILADVARQKAAVNLPQAFRKYVQTPEQLSNLIVTGALEKKNCSSSPALLVNKTQAVHIFCLYRCDRKWFRTC